jgi:hypothetical protein
MKAAETGCWNLATVTRYLVWKKEEKRRKKEKLLCMTFAYRSNL